MSEAALSGRPVIVTYFASWCPPCTHEFEALNTIRDRWSEYGIGIPYLDEEAREGLTLEQLRKVFPDA